MRPRRDIDEPATKLEDTPAPAQIASTTSQPPGGDARTQVTASDQRPGAYAYSYAYSPSVDDPVLASLLPPQQQQPISAHAQPALSDQWPSSGFDPLPLRAVADALDDDFRFDDVPGQNIQQQQQQQQQSQQHQHQHQQQPDYQHAFFPSAAPSTVSPGSNGLYITGTAWECDEKDDSPESIEQGVEDILTDAQQSELVPWRTTASGFGQTRARSPSAASFSSFLDNLQPSTLQSRLSTTMNQSVLTKGLWKVYHDSFENALSCWLTEKTCPYTYQMLPAPGDSSDATLSEVWDPAWVVDPIIAALFGGTDQERQGNRIVKRVCHLDKSWAKLRNRGPMSAQEDRAASRALQLSIMAFATQWAQGSQRSSAQFNNNGFDGMPFPLDGEFDRMLQESFWHQARRALQDAADCESFRVVLAHIIFSFTQKPLNLDQHAPAASDDGDTSRLDDIIEAEGPPIFLEAATRQVFAHRAKLNRMMGRPGAANPASNLETDDRKVCGSPWPCVLANTS